MAAFHIGTTFKNTAGGRHVAGDELLIEHVDLRGATILDIGASDGATSVDLIERLGDSFAAYVITDRLLGLDAVVLGRHAVFFDSGDRCILVAGPGYVAYPTESRVVALLWRHMMTRAHGEPRSTVTLLNPRALRTIDSDPRVTSQEHDLFREWGGPPADVIKVANLLNSDYFSEDELLLALDLLTSALREGGHLLVMDNPADPLDTTATTALYRRVGRRLEEVAMTVPPPRVTGLVRRRPTP